MKPVTDIQWLYLATGYLLLIIPIGILYYYRTGLVKDSLTSIVRMTVQLLLVGLYLELIFALDNLWINLLWIVIMIIIASYTIVRRSNLNYKLF